MKSSVELQKWYLDINTIVIEDRLALCQLLTFEGRRLRGDLIQVFKLLKGLGQINYNNFFCIRCKH